MNLTKGLALFLLLLVLAACTAPTQLPLSIRCERIASATFAFAVSITPPRGAACHWNFGDGADAEGEQVEHTYARRGTYTVNVNVYVDGQDLHASMAVDAGRNWVADGNLEDVLDQALPNDTIYVTGTYGALLVEKAVEIVADGDATFERLTYRQTGGLLSGVTLVGDDDLPALILDRASPEIRGCTISGNTVVGYGAGVYAIDSRAVFTDCEIADNVAGFGGGGVYAIGSAAFPRFINCTFRSNRSDACGGAILMHAWLSQLLPSYAEFLEVRGCSFLGNRAVGEQVGGAIHIGTGCQAVIADCEYVANSPADVVWEDALPR